MVKTAWSGAPGDQPRVDTQYVENCDYRLPLRFLTQHHVAS